MRECGARGLIRTLVSPSSECAEFVFDPEGRTHVSAYVGHGGVAYERSLMGSQAELARAMTSGQPIPTGHAWITAADIAQQLVELLQQEHTAGTIEVRARPTARQLLPST